MKYTYTKPTRRCIRAEAYNLDFHDCTYKILMKYTYTKPTQRCLRAEAYNIDIQNIDKVYLH